MGNQSVAATALTLWTTETGAASSLKGKDMAVAIRLDRFERTTSQGWVYYNGGSTDRDRFAYGYDRDSSRTYKENTVTSAKSELYSYDFLNRLTVMARGDLNGAKDAISGTAVKEEDYTLDPTGNWSAFVTKTSGTADLSQTRSHVWPDLRSGRYGVGSVIAGLLCRR